jgi:ankyrin repeat protein
MNPVVSRRETPLAGTLSVDLGILRLLGRAGVQWTSETEGNVMALIEAGAKRNVKAGDGRSLLKLCLSVSGDIGWRIGALVKAGADPNERDKTQATLLQLAARHGASAHVERVLSAGASAGLQDSDGRTPLHESFSDARSARALVEAGANVNARDEAGDCPIHTFVRELAGEGPKGCFSPGVVGRRASLRALLDAGADVNAHDADGRTALGLALANRRLKWWRRVDAWLLTDLLGAGASASAFFAEAAWAGCADIVGKALSEGADPNLRMAKGQTPLHKVRTSRGVELPSAAGAEVNAVDSAGRTPLWRALERGPAKLAKQTVVKGSGPREPVGW